MSLKRITGIKIATLDGTADILSGQDLWIADGKIAAILPAGSPAPAAGPVETLSFKNALVIPGMVNSHTHSYSSLHRGGVPGAPLDLFVMEASGRRAKRTMRHLQVGVMMHAVEMLKNGVTGVVDHFRHGAVPTVEAISTAFTGFQQAGMRAAVAPMFEDKIYLDSLPIDRTQLPADIQARWGAMKPPSPADYFAMLEDVVAQWHGKGRMKVLIGVDGPQRCTRELLEQTGKFAARHSLGLHTHLLEAKTQALVAPKDCNGSFIAYLDRFGLIGPKSSMAHFVWCTDLDIELAAERGVNIVHNPVSNLTLGSGIQPAARLLEAGVNVALGSDGSSSTTASIFEAARFASLLSRISQPDCDRWISAPQAMKMAATNGAGVLDEKGSLGIIKPGAHADIAILDLDHPTFRPLGDIWNHLVLYDAGAAVDTVLVGGDIVVRQGRCTTINEADLMAEADEFARHDEEGNREFMATVRAEQPAFKKLLTEALQREAPVDRFAHL